MNILIANHTGTQAHLGCHATTFALEQMLRRRLKPDNIWTDAWNARRSLRRAKSLMPLATNLGMHLPISSYKHFREADIIVVNGEGMFYSSACCKPKSTPRQRLIEAKLAKEVLGKELWIVNHSLYSENKDFDALIQRVYKSADYIAVREERTLQYLQQIGINDAHQAADAVFSLPLPPAENQSPWKDKVFLTDSSAWPRHHMPQFQEKLATFIECLRGRGLDPAYLSIRTDKRDEHIATHLGLEYFSGRNVEEFLAHLQTARLLISGRFHVNVFAILCGVPYLSFEADTYKNLALNEFIKYPLPVLSLGTHPLVEIQSWVQKALEEQDVLRNHLFIQRAILRKLSENNIPANNYYQIDTRYQCSH
jgi:polysaccharide pyruvyl transferase WcaK-like protein